MQIKCLPANLYKFYAYSRSQECLDAHRQQIEKVTKKPENGLFRSLIKTKVSL